MTGEVVRHCKAERLRAWALAAIERHRAEGTLPTSLRHLYYEAVMAGAVGKERTGARRPDQNLTDAVTQLREQGIVEWDAIEDRTRQLEDHRGHGTTVADAVSSLLDSVTIHPWAVLPVLVAESESVAGVLVRVAARYRVPIVPTKGQANGWLRTTVARQLGSRPVAIGYLGDADKAGGDIEANTRRVLADVLDVKQWARIALTWPQVVAHGLPALPRTDRRNGVTYEVCEIEALPQRVLNAEVEAFLDDWRDWSFDDVLEREALERAEIRRRLEAGR